MSDSKSQTTGPTLLELAETLLKACPFCGSRGGIVCNGPSPEQVAHCVAWAEDYDASYYVQCCGCAATAGEAAEMMDAVNVWNRRSAETHG